MPWLSQRKQRKSTPGLQVYESAVPSHMYTTSYSQPTMGLADLPKELLQDILHHAVLDRGLKRGMRLRLVSSKHAWACKTHVGM